MAKRNTITIKEGSLSEEPEWYLILGYISSGLKCRHCETLPPEVHTRTDLTTWENPQFRCRAVVRATNEGGYNSTAVCLDCVLEAAHLVKEG